MITNPSIILADEPTGNLDSKSSDEIVNLLKKSNKEYKQTIIMITHNMKLLNRRQNYKNRRWKDSKLMSL